MYQIYKHKRKQAYIFLQFYENRDSDVFHSEDDNRLISLGMCYSIGKKCFISLLTFTNKT